MKKIIFFLALLCVPAYMLAAQSVPVNAEQVRRENWKALFSSHLFKANGKKVSVSEAVRKRYVGIYTSASWCGPCRMFTPKLIRFYEKNKDKIDIILIGSHWTKEDVCDYMKKYNMPWPGTYRTEPVEDFFRRHNLSGIPDFRIFKRNGELLTTKGLYLEEAQKLLDAQK